MVLHVDSDAAYLVAPKAKSRVAGYFHLSSHPNISKHPQLNGAIHVECKTLQHVVSSAAEAEVAGIFHNAGMALPIRHILTCLGHPQPLTQIKPITPRQRVLPTITSIKNDQKHGICAIIGYETTKHNYNSTFIGTKASTMMPIILPNIMQPYIIETHERNISEINC